MTASIDNRNYNDHNNNMHNNTSNDKNANKGPPQTRTTMTTASLQRQQHDYPCRKTSGKPVLHTQSSSSWHVTVEQVLGIEPATARPSRNGMNKSIPANCGRRWSAQVYPCN